MVVLHSRKEDDARGCFNNFIICCQFLSTAIPKLLWCGYAFSKAIGKWNSMLYAKHMWSIILDGLVLQEDKFINEV